MEKAVLKAVPRQIVGKQVRALRRSGQLPAILYGHGMQPMAVSLDAREATHVLNHVTASSLVTVDLEGKEYPTLVREQQRHPIKGSLLHVDFQVVSLTEKIRANVGIVLTGTSPAVKDFNAVLVTGLSELEVECLPQALPERIVVDISTLTKIGDGIHVRDIVLSEEVTILDNPGEMIVLAAAPAKEEEAVAAEAVVEGAAEPEVIEKGKKEEEEEAGEG